MLLHDQAFDDFFKRAIKAVIPYADSLVCIGGCANALYRHHPLATRPWPVYLGTTDLDWAVPQSLQIPASKDSVSKLMKDAGFQEEPHGTADVPVIKYRPKEQDSPAEVEFLCPLSGLRGSRNSRTRVSTQVQPGLYAQPLRYLDLLLHRPWSVNMNGIAGFEDVAGLHVLVPNPSAYVVQKILIREQNRPVEDMAKDCYYIYEISVIFRQAMDRLHEEYQAIESCFPAKWAKTFKASFQRLFSAENSEGPSSAVRVHESTGAVRQAEGMVTPRMVHLSGQKLVAALS